jgi:hypothetical protein
MNGGSGCSGIFHCDNNVDNNVNFFSTTDKVRIHDLLVLLISMLLFFPYNEKT